MGWVIPTILFCLLPVIFIIGAAIFVTGYVLSDLVEIIRLARQRKAEGKGRSKKEPSLKKAIAKSVGLLIADSLCLFTIIYALCDIFGS